MIKINLLGDEVVTDSSSNLLIAAYVASLLVCLGIFYVLNSSIAEHVAKANSEAAKLERHLATLQETTKEVKELDRKRSELNDKLLVIATLKRNKAGPVRVMDDLNMALPERAWVEEVKETLGVLRLVGKALDNQTIAVYMKDLGASDYFSAVDLVQTRQIEIKGVKLVEFTLDAKISYIGKLALKKANEQAPATQNLDAVPALKG